MLLCRGRLVKQAVKQPLKPLKTLTLMTKSGFAKYVEEIVLMTYLSIYTFTCINIYMYSSIHVASTLPPTPKK